MGLRFRKRIKLFSGVRVNLSKSGASLSLGGKGATINYSKSGRRTTVGIPGSGLSYSELHKNDNPTTPTTRVDKSFMSIIYILAAIFGIVIAYFLAGRV